MFAKMMKKIKEWLGLAVEAVDTVEDKLEDINEVVDDMQEELAELVDTLDDWDQDDDSQTVLEQYCDEGDKG